MNRISQISKKYPKLKPFKFQNAKQKYYLECTRCKTIIYYNVSKYFQFGLSTEIKIKQLTNIKIQIQAKKQKIQSSCLKKDSSSTYIPTSNKLIVFCQCCSNNGKNTFLGEIVAKPATFSDQIDFLFIRSDKNLIQTKVIQGKKFKKDQKYETKQYLKMDNLQYLVKSYSQIKLKRIKTQLIRLILYWQKLLINKILQAQRKIEINSFYQLRMIIFRNFYQSLNKNKTKKKKRDSLAGKDSNIHHQIEL